MSNRVVIFVSLLFCMAVCTGAAVLINDYATGEASCWTLNQTLTGQMGAP